MLEKYIVTITPALVNESGGWIQFHRVSFYLLPSGENITKGRWMKQGELLNFLASHVPKDRVTIRTNAKVKSLDVEKRQVTLHTGETVQGDVIVGADGVKSNCRSAIIGREPPIVMTAYAYRYQVPAESLKDKPELSGFLTDFRSWSKDRYRFTTYPVKSFQIANLVGLCPPELFSIKNSEESWTLDASPEEVERNFKTLGCDYPKELNSVYKWLI